jgi:hypothetical protein
MPVGEHQAIELSNRTFSGFTSRCTSRARARSRVRRERAHDLGVRG